MTDDESTVAYDELMGILRARRDQDQPAERDDYVQAIEAEVALGKPITVNLNVADDRKPVDPVAGVRTSGTSGKVEFVASQEYSGREKLGILLDLFELATLAPPKMARQMIDALGSISELKTVSSFNFGSDLDSSAVRSMPVESVINALQAITGLESLLQELRSEMTKKAS